MTAAPDYRALALLIFGAATLSGCLTTAPEAEAPAPAAVAAAAPAPIAKPETPGETAARLKAEEQERRIKAKCGGSIACEYREERAAELKQKCAKLGGVKIGMTPAQIKASCWGEPKTVNQTLTARGKHEQWVYGSGQYLYLDDGVLTSIQTSE